MAMRHSQRILMTLLHLQMFRTIHENQSALLFLKISKIMLRHFLLRKMFPIHLNNEWILS